jgi:AcrR family transcriptional regulator
MGMKVQILEKSRALFMKYGIKSVTMDDIASALGISKKTIYQHIKNKEDLLLDLLELMNEEDTTTVKRLVINSQNAIEAMMNIATWSATRIEMISEVALFDLKKYYPLIWDTIIRKEREKIYELTKVNIQWGKREGLYHSDIDEDLVSRIHVGHALFITDDELFPIQSFPRYALIVNLMKNYLLSICTSSGKDVLEMKMKQIRKQ